MSQIIRIATRKSQLALWQANFVKAELIKHHPDLTVELVPLTSRGDQVLDIPLNKVGGKGLFVKELEHALLNNEADIAVHSMKDVPMEFPEGLGLATICEREDPRDAFVSNHYKYFKDLPEGAVVGTSSLRRQSQLLAARPDLKIAFLRGNVNTRLKKLDDGEFDAIILAAAGLIRLEMRDRIAELLATELSLPAGGQGAVGIEIRTADKTVAQLLAPLHHEKTAAVITAERAVVATLEGGCQVPIGAYAEWEDDQLWLRSLVASNDGSECVRCELRGAASDAEVMGVTAAKTLIKQGADRLLAQSQ